MECVLTSELCACANPGAKVVKKRVGGRWREAKRETPGVGDPGTLEGVRSRDHVETR